MNTKLRLIVIVFVMGTIQFCGFAMNKPVSNAETRRTDLINLLSQFADNVVVDSDYEDLFLDDPKNGQESTEAIKDDEESVHTGMEDSIWSDSEKNANKDSEEEGHIDSLGEAVIQRDTASVRRLLAGQADPNKQDDEGYTPLAAACMRPGTLEIVTLLCEAKADPSVANNNGNNALALAQRFNRHQLYKYLTTGKI